MTRDEGYAREYENGLDFVESLGGVPWCEAPAPPRRHTCWAQTRGIVGRTGYVERCPCGAIGPPPFVMVGRDVRRVARSRIARGLEALRGLAA